MDWYLPAGDATTASALRRAITSYLSRHAAPGSDLENAGLAVSELMTNALLHTGSSAWVSLEWGGEQPVLSVYDLGPEFAFDGDSLPADPLSPGGRGLFIASHVASDLEVAHRRGGGNVVSARLPVRRPRVASHDPPASTFGALPDPAEAGPHGFGKESFLRALVVQLAQAVELQHGPQAAEAAVAQVGTDVGGRMEAEYRKAQGIVGRLDSEQMANAYVRLKHAIDGGFYVIEATDEKIVLGNTACPFGPNVRRSPALCRMTSSVFGGIAARNAGGATVVLEERIAVGDPGCRVTVFLGSASEQLRARGHTYAPPQPDPS